MSCPRLWYASSKQNCQVELEDHDHEAEVRQASQVSAANDTGESRHDVDEQFWHSKRHRRKHAARQSPPLPELRHLNVTPMRIPKTSCQ